MEYNLTYIMYNYYENGKCTEFKLVHVHYFGIVEFLYIRTFGIYSNVLHKGIYALHSGCQLMPKPHLHPLGLTCTMYYVDL